MAIHTFERSLRKPPYSETLQVETNFSEAEIQLFNEIEKLTKKSDFLRGVTEGSGHVRTFSLDYDVPYGYTLQGSRESVLTGVIKSRDFVAANLEVIKRQTPYCADIMEQILEKLNLIIGNKVV
jgi:hypothetical protein